RSRRRTSSMPTAARTRATRKACVVLRYRRRRSFAVVHGERRVVGEARLAQDRARLQPLAQRRRDELVVDAPTDVVGARGAAVAPPGVVLAFRVECTVGVDPAAGAVRRAVAAAVLADPAVEPGAFGRQAAGVLLVRFPV